MCECGNPHNEADQVMNYVQRNLRKKRVNHEHTEQVKVVNWARRNAQYDPELANLFAIPNGGKRHINVAKSMKAEGVQAGVPDMFLAVARGGYHGLFIEMKHGTNTISDKQKNCIDRLEAQGYTVSTCYGSEQAITVIKDYLGIIDPTD